MVSRFEQPTRSGWAQVPAILALLVLVLLAPISINLFGYAVAFIWAPLWAVVFWPRSTLPIIGILAIMLAGLVLDATSFGVLGQWSLAYLICFAILRPFQREDRVTFLGAIPVWIIACVIIATVLTIAGWFIYGILPDFLVMAQQAGLATLCLPLFLLLRHLTRYYLTDPDERQM